MSNRHSVTAPIGYKVDGHVLLVEDEMMVLFVLEQNMADLGCERISSASTVEHARTMIDKNNFDVVVLDLNLDGKSSEPIAHLLVERKIPFFFCTGHGEARVPGFSASVLQKPFSHAELALEFSKILPYPTSR